jgi:hypothetical protein
LAAFLLVAASSAAAARGVRFTKKPSARRAGDAVSVSFAVSHDKDVVVSVVDDKGDVVRHLAAGLLGKNAPAPLAKNSLRQSITWDGNDDLGRRVQGPVRIRVGIGMRPAFGRLIGFNPGGLGMVRSLAVGPNGTLYVFHRFGDIHPGDATTVCCAYDRAGSYLRQVLPWPANTPDAKLRGVKRITVEGEAIPFLYQAETRTVVPGLGDLPAHRSVVTSDGRLAFVGHQEWVGTATRYNRRGLAQVVVVRTDGSIPEPALRTVLASDTPGGVSLALSPDEKTLYASGYSTGSGRKQKVHPAVLRFGWTDEKPAVFAGDLARPGAGQRLRRPTSVATDADGNVYVADRDNNRVAVFAPDGKYLGQISVPLPFQVAVHRRTGAVYTLGGTYCEQLKKFASREEKKPAIEAEVPCYKAPKKNYRALLALDDSADPPVVWIAPQSNWIPHKLMRIEDAGDAFGKPVDIAKLPANSKPNAGPRTHHKQWTGGAISGMALDRRNQVLYVNARKVDLKTGKWSKGTLLVDGTKDGVGSFGLDGNLYSQRYPGDIVRVGPDLKPIPFPEQKEPGRIALPGRNRLRGRGITADAAGNLYVLRERGKDGRPEDPRDANHLVLVGPDGKEKRTLIDSEIRPLNSVRLDAAGNLYLAVGVRPRGKLVPDAFRRLDLGRPWKYGMNTHDLNWYPLLYGSIVKFPPEGGTIRSAAGGTNVEYSFEKRTQIKGAEWMFFGASPVPSWRLRFPDTCLCESPRFDVDGYGRSIFPDAARFRCGILDTAGNPIAWFGAYGNQDSAGPTSTIPKPAIAFYWPFEICAGEDVVYVADRLNRRVVQVDLEYAAEATVDVR